MNKKLVRKGWIEVVWNEMLLILIRCFYCIKGKFK